MYTVNGTERPYTCWSAVKKLLTPLHFVTVDPNCGTFSSSGGYCYLHIALSSCNKTLTDCTNVMQMRMRRFQMLHDMACIVVKWATEDGDAEEVCQKQLMMSTHVWPSAVEVQWWLVVRQRSWIRVRGSGKNSEEFSSVSTKHHSHWCGLCSSDDALRLPLCNEY